MADPLPQAIVLTAIVINLGLTAFVLAMAYRSWQLHGHDEVQDDLEDRRLAARLLDEDIEQAERDDVDLETEAAEARDETEEGDLPAVHAVERRSEERRVGKERRTRRAPWER